MKKGKIIYILALLFFGCIFLFSRWKVYSALIAYNENEETYQELAQEYTRQEEEYSDEIDVDFNALLAECPDVVGWIYCPDTQLNYPFVQAQDNDYYLRRLLNGKWNIGGSIFMDYRCPADFSGFNTIIYGHNMKNGSMFGSILNYQKQEYYDAHPIIYVITPQKRYTVNLIGGYTVESADEDTYSLPQTAEERDVLVEKAKLNSTFKSEITVKGDDKLVTLSTCSYAYENARYVLVGVIKETRKRR